MMTATISRPNQFLNSHFTAKLYQLLYQLNLHKPPEILIISTLLITHSCLISYIRTKEPKTSSLFFMPGTPPDEFPCGGECEIFSTPCIKWCANEKTTYLEKAL